MPSFLNDFYDSYVKSGIFRKFVHLNQLIALSVDVEQKPHSEYSNIASQTEM